MHAQVHTLGDRLRLKKDIIVTVLTVVFLLVSMSFLIGHQEPNEFPQEITENVDFAGKVNAGEKWLRANVLWLTRGAAAAVRWALERVELFLLFMPWPVVVLSFSLLALAKGGVRLAIVCVVCTMFWGFMDMWDPAMETLGLMTVAVFLSVVFGVLIGVAASQSNTIEAIVRPILDTMQTMPAFVYLIPAIFLFGIGGPPAVIATVVYAIPPAVRLTNLGIRQVSPETIEAATSFGSTRIQTLLKVKLPLALPSIMMGINQTTMMALGLVVLATFIGAAGLGYEVWQALRHLNVGWSLEGGLSIVFMAIVFDRISYAMSEEPTTRRAGDFRLLPRSWEHTPSAQAPERVLAAVCDFFALVGRLLAGVFASVLGFAVQLVNSNAATATRSFIMNHSFFVFSMVILTVFYFLGNEVKVLGSFPSALVFELRDPVDEAVDFLVVNKAFIATTTWIRASVFLYLLKPLTSFLQAMPWWYCLAGLGGFIWLTASGRLALFCVVAMFFVGAFDLWSIAMFTLAAVLVSVILCFLIGVPLGILAACSDGFESFLKPILDAMQTMPAFVYLIPVLMFFGGNVVSAVIATVIYALPPMIRLTNLGIRQVPSSAVEAADSFGSTFLQTMLKVKIPLAIPSMMMGLNQSVMMGLAMAVITPLIGGGGLGQEVFTALAVVNTGMGLEAGLSIVILAVVMDRITQAWSVKQRAALGID